MIDIKRQMLDVAVLYYKKGFTQQQIADTMGITRQTVSKLLNLALDNNIVEIKINEPESATTELEEKLEKKLGVCSVKIGTCSGGDEMLRGQAVIRKSCEYLSSLFIKGNLKIGISWGRTIESVIESFPEIKTENNIVFPLLGASDRKKSCYFTNKLASDLGDKILGESKYLTFPFMASKEDCELIKKTSVYNEFNNLWQNMDVAIVGIGNLLSLYTLQSSFGKKEIDKTIVGDIASHLFNKNGEIVELYKSTLCATLSNLKKAKTTVAIAYGKDKVEPIISAVKTNAIDTLITDEYTAKEVLNS